MQVLLHDVLFSGLSASGLICRAGVADTNPASHAISADQMIYNLLEGLETSREQLHGMARTEMLERLHERVHSDFEEKRIVLNQGMGIVSKRSTIVCSKSTFSNVTPLLNT